MNNVQLVMNGLKGQDDITKANVNFSAIKILWTTCRRSDLMLWMLDKLNFNDDMLLRLYACASVRKTPAATGQTVWDLLSDTRSRNAVDTTERYAKGEANEEENNCAWEDAMDAIWVGSWSDSGRPYWNLAKDTVKAAANEAARNATERDALQAAIGASWSAARASGLPEAIEFQANLLRAMIPWETIESFIIRSNKDHQLKIA